MSRFTTLAIALLVLSPQGPRALLCAQEAGARSTARDQVAEPPASLNIDHSPHSQRLIDVGGGVRLHVLDWGGTGRTIVFVPGYGLNAHVYDDFAPRLVAKFHVVALTLRGWNPSDAPPRGYTNEMAAHDIVAILDSLGVKQADLVGHSFGGDVITKVASLYPTRVHALVYLDAAFAIAGRDSVWSLQPFHRPPPVRSARPDTTFAGYIAAYSSYAGKYIYGVWTPALQNELVARLHGLSLPQIVERDSLVGLYGHEAPADALQVDYSAVTQPALAICAIATAKTLYPWLTSDSSRWTGARAFADTTLRPFLRRECGAFLHQAKSGSIAMLDSSHFVFILNADDTLILMRRFLIAQQ